MSRPEGVDLGIVEAAEEAEAAVVEVEALNTRSWKFPRQTLTLHPLMPNSTRWTPSRRPSRQAHHLVRA